MFQLGSNKYTWRNMPLFNESVITYFISCIVQNKFCNCILYKLYELYPKVWLSKEFWCVFEKNISNPNVRMLILLKSILIHSSTALVILSLESPWRLALHQKRILVCIWYLFSQNFFRINICLMGFPFHISQIGLLTIKSHAIVLSLKDSFPNCGTLNLMTIAYAFVIYISIFCLCPKFIIISKPSIFSKFLFHTHVCFHQFFYNSFYPWILR